MKINGFTEEKNILHLLQSSQHIDPASSLIQAKKTEELFKKQLK